MSRWYQIVVKGKSEEIERFLEQAGAGLSGQVIRGSTVHLEPESLAERLRDLLGADSHHMLFASEETARALLAALAGHEVLELDQLNQIEGGRFAFRIEAYSEQEREDIRLACLTELPGVRLVGLEESVERDPSAKGPEFFAPAHDYVYRAEGAMEGTAPGILEAYRRAAEQDFVHPKPLALQNRNVPPADLASRG
ncbi:MAG TPA: hypothetical protein VEG34_07185 [Thermoanaerobaculia bacterium]|nr:hypothetical protein [Thermoanaerobaculia bacterium]